MENTDLTADGELGIGTVVHGDFDEVVERTRAAIAEGGFGVLTEIDVTATLRDKIGREIERLLILGACNPSFAAEALDASRDVSLVMPCNVVVREDPALGADAVRVVAMSPTAMGRMAGVAGVGDLMGRAEEMMRGIIGSLE
ncbi:DUF302 domain-containing protein [Corynebacterium sphenisci]|uniref:DUF302 domain-containing protein n=1 Tax=Corynebacterium sphenisci TaxID=191493 RepID=UPI0026E0DA4A|nr:DUF302 domain-containing protein [Corynebacterium sphenisci]MDO5730659.1 DUF302 domain-containing protein [Corynebacterium sphenisci]